jgi:hypothetical protein
MRVSYRPSYSNLIVGLCEERVPFSRTAAEYAGACQSLVIVAQRRELIPKNPSGSLRAKLTFPEL